MLLSHVYENPKYEKPLVQHLKNVTDKCLHSVDKKILSFNSINKEEFCSLAKISGLFHDFGKSTTYFQDYLVNKRKKDAYTHHSQISALVAFYVAKDKGFDDKWAYMVYQVISRHHGDLRDFENIEIGNEGIIKLQASNILESKNYNVLSRFYSENNFDINDIINNFSTKINEFKEFIEDIDDFIDDLIDSNDYFEYFFINNYLFSLLIESDKADAAQLSDDYFTDNLKEVIYNTENYLESMRKVDGAKFDISKPINKVRQEFLESISNSDLISCDKHIYSITAPTGIGKTFGCMLFAEILKKKLKEDKNIDSRIIYALPYTSIIDQNYLEFEKVIKSFIPLEYQQKPTRYLLKHHYLSPFKVENRRDEEEKKKYKDYLDDKLFIESWQSSIVITTYVQILHSIFGYKNSFLKKVHNIANSIIILDEVQNINPQYHYLIGKALEVFAKIFNVYFLQLTATQPKIFDPKSNTQIVQASMFMTNDIFNRVSIEIKREIDSIESFISYFNADFDDNNCLIVVNTKKMATDLFREISKEKDDYTCYCLTTNLTPHDRINFIKEIKTLLPRDKKIIVISTQLIEAGVDLSFKRVYRDFAPMDSLVQVAGRCNRHCEYGQKNGKMTIFNTDNNKIYSKSLLQYTSEVLYDLTNFEDKNFSELVEKYFNKFSFNATSDELINAIRSMNYDTKGIRNQLPLSEFRVIDEYPQQSLYVLHVEGSEEKMEELLTLLNTNLWSINKEEKDVILLRLEDIKYELLPYRISIPKYVYQIYKNIIKPLSNDDDDYFYQYISYKDCRECVYDDDIGFLSEPKENISSLIMM